MIVSHRKFVLSLLLACALLTPAQARAQDDRDTYVRIYREDGTLVAPPPVHDYSMAVHQSIDAPKTTAAATAVPPAPRPAESTPVPTKQNTVSPPPGHRAAPVPAATGTVSGNLIKIESFGTLHDARSGGLGVDMWDGSDRSAVTGLIKQLPDASHYRTVAGLVRRVLLTDGDASLLSGGGDPAPGEDLLTLRVRKLMAMGALDDAAALYKENPLPPHDSTMAATGITALLADAQPALACLETKSLGSRYGGTPAWQPLDGFCSYLIGKMSGKSTGVASGDGILQQMAGSASYRYHAASLRDLDKLSTFDRVALFADHRVDYAAVGNGDAAGLSPMTLSMIVHDESAPLTLRFNLLLAGARTGIFVTKDIAEFYKAIPFKNLAQTDAQISGAGAPGWQRVAWLYKSGDTAHGLIDKSVLQAALPLKNTYGMVALWPFAALLQTVEPQGMPADSIRTGIMLGLATGQTIPESWGTAWKNSATDEKSDLLARIAYRISGNPGADSISSEENLLSEIKALPQHESTLLLISLDQLDKGKKFHNINEPDLYENGASSSADDGATEGSGSVLDNLKAAENDRRLGETVLLASLALEAKNVDSAEDNLSSSVFRQALNGYRIVGLNKESRAFAMEVMLGLK